MNVMILSNNEAFSKLKTNDIAMQHFIAYGDGPNHFRIVKDRLHGLLYGSKITSETLHWYISQCEKR